MFLIFFSHITRYVVNRIVSSSSLLLSQWQYWRYMAIKKQNPHIKINEWMNKKSLSRCVVKGWNITTLEEKHTFSSSCYVHYKWSNRKNNNVVNVCYYCRLLFFPSSLTLLFFSLLHSTPHSHSLAFFISLSVLCFSTKMNQIGEKGVIFLFVKCV